MIPFAILSGKIKTKTDEKEIRLLELSPDYFTFRLLKEQAQKYVQQLSDAGQQGNIVLSFFQFQKRSYHEVILNCTRDVVKIELMPQKQMEGLVCEIRVDVKNEEYRIYTERFNKEYLNYIYLKLDETEADMSKALVGYPSEKEQTYSDTLKKQRAAWTQVPNEAKKSLAERVDGIELDNPAWYQAYLSKPLKDFISLYWESSGWIDIDLCKIAWRVPKYFYIGNAYCFHLFPKKTQLEAMLEKTWSDHIFPVCVFAPVEEKDLIKIEKILNVLEDHQISKETIEKCLTVLAKGKASEIEKMFEVLDKYHISKENIEKNFGNIFSKSINKFDAIFSRNSENIKMYMKLKGYYDKIVTKEELNQIAQFKNVDTEKIICSVLNQKYIETYKKTIEEKGGLYIGKSIPMNKNDMSKYENIILDISKNISNLMSYKYKYDKQELESFCISTLIEKCGDVIYNNDVNKEFLYGTLYNKTKKYCIGYILKEKNNYSIDISKWENTTKTSKYNKSGMVKKDELDVKQWNLKSEEDEEAMKILSNYLEMGYDNKKAFENTAKDLELDIEELMYNIEEIKNQILNKNKENNEQEKDEK